ncbi:sensor histidine kinase [Streptomyces sp. GTA36]
MDWDVRFTPAVKRLIVGAVLLAFALTWVADLAVLSMSPDPWHPATNWLPSLVTGPTCVLVLAAPRRSSLPVRVSLMIALSLTVTGWCLITPQQHSSLGVLECAALLFMLIRVVGQVPRTLTAALCATGLGLAVLLTALRPRTADALVAGGYILTVIVAVCIALGCVIRAGEFRRRRAIQDVRQAERLALARDLHDLIAHHMTGIIVQANAAATIHATSPEKVEPMLRAIARSGTETLDSMRRLVRVLREDNHTALRPGDLLSELAQFVSTYCATAVAGAPEEQARLEATVAARTVALSPELEISVYRIVQEALTNARRHAPRAQVTVRLDADDTWLHVTVSNTASPGHNSAPAGGGSGFGLIGLQERVDALDGTFAAGPVARGGWQIKAALPLPLRSPSTTPV